MIEFTDAAVKIWRSDGLKGFYRGFTASVLTSTPYSGTAAPAPAPASFRIFGRRVLIIEQRFGGAVTSISKVVAVTVCSPFLLTCAWCSVLFGTVFPARRAAFAGEPRNCKRQRHSDSDLSASLHADARRGDRGPHLRHHHQSHVGTPFVLYFFFLLIVLLFVPSVVTCVLKRDAGGADAATDTARARCRSCRGTVPQHLRRVLDHAAQGGTTRLLQGPRAAPRHECSHLESVQHCLRVHPQLERAGPQAQRDRRRGSEIVTAVPREGTVRVQRIVYPARPLLFRGITHQKKKKHVDM